MQFLEKELRNFHDTVRNHAGFLGPGFSSEMSEKILAKFAASTQLLSPSNDVGLPNALMKVCRNVEKLMPLLYYRHDSFTRVH